MMSTGTGTEQKKIAETTEIKTGSWQREEKKCKQIKGWNEGVNNEWREGGEGDLPVQDL